MSSRNDRNNNPGNLRPGTGGDPIWDGQLGTDADGFATFSNRAAGVRAADLNLQTYAKRGWNTVSSIIHHWSSTDQETYTNFVADRLGVKPEEKLDLDDPKIRKSVLGHIFDFEGSKYAGDSTAWNALNRASGGGW